MPSSFLGAVGLFHFALPLRDPVEIFALVLFIILLGPILLRRLRIPGIIGMILSGVLIGPHGFHMLDFDSAIRLFSMVGLLYIMFLAGLELDFNEFMRNRGRSFLFGLLTFSLPLGLGFLLCRYLLHFAPLPSLLVASTLSSHTLVAYPLASRLGITRNKAVTIAVGGTILTDALVLLLLTGITHAVAGNLNPEFWVRTGISLSVFLGAVFFLFPLMARWLFKNLQGEASAQYVFILALVFSAGLLAEVAGMEALIGAFMAGLALNRLVPATSPLMTRIEFVGNTLFIPFFLISVGMRVDLHVFLTGSGTLLLALALLSMGIFSKWLAAYLAQLGFRFSAPQRNILFGLSTARAAATLAVILVGFEHHIVGEDVLNATIIVILITCLVSSILTENAGRKIALQEEPLKSGTEADREQMLVLLSSPAHVELLVDLTVALGASSSGSSLMALTVVLDNPEADQEMTQASRLLDLAVKHGSACDQELRGVVRVDMDMISGVSRAVKENRVTDLVMGWSSRIRTTELLFGTKLGSLIGEVWGSIFSCRLLQPLNTISTLLILVPPNAEYEIGFGPWVSKISRLANHCGSQIRFHGTERSMGALRRELEAILTPPRCWFNPLDDPEQYPSILEQMQENETLVLVSARKGTISYHPGLDHLTGRLNRLARGHNFIVLYPWQHSPEGLEGSIRAADLSLSPLREQARQWTRLKHRLQGARRSRDQP